LSYERESPKPEDFDDAFHKLAQDVARVLDENKDGTSQREQVEGLMLIERKFRDSICRYAQSRELYRRFILMVAVENKNILSARPYFREKAETFSSKITPAIKAGDVEALKKFDVNYHFLTFAKKSWRGPFPKMALKYYNLAIEARRKLIENNIPLAINRAKLFFRRTPRSHLELSDLINICVMGLCAGVDKWVGDYRTVFRSVCIGRMSGNMVDSYSETLLHFYPSDKRVLYKANTISGRQDISDVRDLADAVKQSFANDAAEGKSVPKEDVSYHELHALMSGASTVSADAPLGEEGLTVHDKAACQRPSPEANAEHADAMGKMFEAAEGLPLILRKVLTLKGVRT